MNQEEEINSAREYPGSRVGNSSCSRRPWIKRKRRILPPDCVLYQEEAVKQECARDTAREDPELRGDDRRCSWKSWIKRTWSIPPLEALDKALVMDSGGRDSPGKECTTTPWSRRTRQPAAREGGEICDRAGEKGSTNGKKVLEECCSVPVIAVFLSTL